MQNLDFNLLQQTAQPQNQDEQDWVGVEDEEGSEVDDEQNQELTILTSSAAAPLRTARIQQAQVLPEYPQTLPRGYTYCVSTDKRDIKEVLQEALAFQYCRKNKAKKKGTTCLYLGGQALRWKYQCTGAKYCQYLENSLRTRSHCHASAQLWEELRQYRRTPLREETNKKKRHSLGLYLTVQPNFTPNKLPSAQNGGSRRNALRTISLEGLQRSMIMNTFRSCLERVLNMSQRLQKLAVLLNQIRRDYQNVNHPQGHAHFLQWTCPVEFDIIIPLHLERIPFFLFCSHGEHTHLPPPPHRPPEEIIQGITKLIQRERDPTVTQAQFLSSPALKEFCRQNNAVSLIQIHQSFANMDRITRILWRERLAMFPAGQHVQGVIVEHMTKHQNPERAYIREIFVEDEQAEVFASLKTFQCDMSFKRTFKNGFREITFAFFNESHGKLFTLARIFVNSDSPQMYMRCFQRLFTLLSERTGKNLNCWRHLHNEGFDGMTVDMDWKRMEGFGLYLTELDTSRRPWDWQLQNCIRFCVVHFKRSITQATPGSERHQDSVCTRMQALLTCESMEDYHTLGNLLRAQESAPIANWAAHKLIPVIAAGLNQHCSLIPKDVWNTMSPNSNAAEQAAEKSYSYGKGLPVLSAVLSGMKLDQRDIDQLGAREDDLQQSLISSPYKRVTKAFKLIWYYTGPFKVDSITITITITLAISSSVSKELKSCHCY
ncbi:uncharacterized protein BDR25DRAFT_309026 [Lindgomyces ingoldianus]|uniref:Uncharacterized protein n=1 Tax=Lindgomyces ingoldianus TaxID=673940 RepID=A0ACB6RFY8_9PLEO|nr:uncharacterized protein BDR25DRAFT_309026 [Lindgomyces ingoldianus]KAF2478233.1 hypothetical protein BDR25DRAFT_309026 [Lindgomyces ingoldianus]